jgi:glutathione S-transferase
MNNLTKNVIASVLFALPAFGLACEYPERPTLPDGGTASKEQMIAAQASVKAFLAAVDEYLNCIEQEEEEAVAALPEVDESDDEAVKGREAEIKRRDDLLEKRFDAANEEKFLFGEKWNQQVRAYNDRKAQ